MQRYVIAYESPNGATHVLTGLTYAGLEDVKRAQHVLGARNFRYAYSRTPTWLWDELSVWFENRDRPTAEEADAFLQYNREHS